jgi:hypothetical protein
MRVAIFFDGKNFYRGYQTLSTTKQVDFVRLSRWLLTKVGGDVLTGAHYYTGVESSLPTESVTSTGIDPLIAFLDHLERQSGFFVYRFPRKKRRHECRECKQVTTYTTEKEVDTTMVADMLRLAAVNAFDILILLSGDSDHSPAVEGVRSLGKIAYVGTWGPRGLSGRLRKAAFDHIDLTQGLAAFLGPVSPATDESSSPTTVVSLTERHETKVEVLVENTTRINDDSDETTDSSSLGADAAFLSALADAQHHFRTGHVGVNYFLKKWRYSALTEDLSIRSRILDRLVRQGAVEIYTGSNGDKSLRATKPLTSPIAQSSPRKTPNSGATT